MPLKLKKPVQNLFITLLINDIEKQGEMCHKSSTNQYQAVYETASIILDAGIASSGRYPVVMLVPSGGVIYF